MASVICSQKPAKKYRLWHLFFPCIRPKTTKLKRQKSAEAIIPFQTDTETKKRKSNKVVLLSINPLGTDFSYTPKLKQFSPFETTLLEEGLLQSFGPRESIPVLTIANGFTDNELLVVSKQLPLHKQLFTLKPQSIEQKKIGAINIPKDIITSNNSYHQFPYKGVSFWKRSSVVMGDRRAHSEGEVPMDTMGEAMIDGLPASAWLECVEPTLSILISLNTLKHRRSNLSRKKGLPENLDSNRCRHGDFEYGPVALYQRPDLLQHMMAYRAELLNDVSALAPYQQDNQDQNEVGQHPGNLRSVSSHHLEYPFPNDNFLENHERRNNPSSNLRASRSIS